jgi:hypothetical protein
VARIRSIKPEFWDDRKLARSTSRDARMLYMALWNQSDEHARCNGDPDWLKGRAFPYDDDVTPAIVDRWLEELAVAGRIVRYEVDGDPFLYVPKLPNHQRLEPAKAASRIPAPPDPSPAQIFSDESARDADPPEQLAPLYVAGSREQVAGSMEHVSAAQSADDTPEEPDPKGTRIPDGWQPSAADITWSRAEGNPDDWSRRCTESFCDYWRGMPGARGRKADWSATWRNWLRREMENRGSRASPPRSQTASEKASGWMTIPIDERKAIT